MIAHDPIEDTLRYKQIQAEVDALAGKKAHFEENESELGFYISTAYVAVFLR